jgi:hypothetical protein
MMLFSNWTKAEKTCPVSKVLNAAISSHFSIIKFYILKARFNQIEPFIFTKEIMNLSYNLIILSQDPRLLFQQEVPLLDTLICWDVRHLRIVRMSVVFIFHCRKVIEIKNAIGVSIIFIILFKAITFQLI